MAESLFFTDLDLVLGTMDEHVPRLPRHVSHHSPSAWWIWRAQFALWICNIALGNDPLHSGSHCSDRRWMNSHLKYRTDFANDFFCLPVYCVFNSWPSIPCIRWIYQAGINWHFSMIFRQHVRHHVFDCPFVFHFNHVSVMASRASYGILEALVSDSSSSFAWQRIHERKSDWQEEIWRDGASWRGWTDQSS